MIDPTDLDVSIVLPVYNEAGHVASEIARIKSAMAASAYSYEIIVVDDGSTDGSTSILADMDGIKLIRLTRNSGSGTARRVGTGVARGEVVVWSDVDMTYPNNEIPRLVKELEGYDQVVGARTSEAGSVRLLRAPAKWSIRRLASYLVQDEIPDLNSGFRAFRRSVGAQFLHQLPRGFSCVTTLSMSFLSNGYSLKYIPISYGKRAGKSKFHWWTDTRRYVTQVIRMMLSYEPLRVFLPIGSVLFFLGLGKLIFDISTRSFRVAIDTLVILFAALQCFTVGFLADLVVRSSKPPDLVSPAFDERP